MTAEIKDERNSIPCIRHSSVVKDGSDINISIVTVDKHSLRKVCYIYDVYYLHNYYKDKNGLFELNRQVEPTTRAQMNLKSMEYILMKYIERNYKNDFVASLSNVKLDELKEYANKIYRVSYNANNKLDAINELWALVANDIFIFNNRYSFWDFAILRALLFKYHPYRNLVLFNLSLALSENYYQHYKYDDNPMVDVLMYMHQTNNIPPEIIDEALAINSGQVEFK